MEIIVENKQTLQDELNALQELAAEKHERNVGNQREAAGRDPYLEESKEVRRLANGLIWSG